MALIIALMTMFMMTALGTALMLLAVTETAVSGHHRFGAEALYAADAAAELALQELQAGPDWNTVLSGHLTSALADGPPAGVRNTTAGPIDLVQATVAATTEDRPWGANNPAWQLYLYGSLGVLLRLDRTDSDMYVVVWVGDDPLECDGHPEVDGDPCVGGAVNAGQGVIAVLAHAYGPAGVRRAVETTAMRANPLDGEPGPSLRVLSWREVR